MKKRFLYAAAASVMVLCSACSNQTAPAEENDVTQEDSSVNSESTSEVSTVTPETNDQRENESETATETTDTPAASDAGESDEAPRPQIIFETIEDSDTAEDGTLLYTSLCAYPVVTIEGNESAAEKINADIRAEVDDFLSYAAMTRDTARDIYNNYYLTDEEADSEYGFFNYSRDFDMSVTRNDNNVLSFLSTDSVYEGGAHGNYSFAGFNYNAATGEPIAFSDLAENAETFHADTLAYLKELITTKTYQDILFESAADDLEETLYQDTKWYLSTSGLVFFSDPYALGPYASGKIEFTIPYSVLTEMGLKEEYAYHNNLTIQLQSEEPFLLDINGDGQEDSVQFYITDIGSIDAKLHLIINGTDFAQENEELSKLLAEGEYDYSWADCYLYDMDMTDDTIEIALYMNHYYNVNDEEIYGSSFFYRYEKDGTFSYVDMTRGSIADPTTVVPSE